MSYVTKELPFQHLDFKRLEKETEKLRREALKREKEAEKKRREEIKWDPSTLYNVSQFGNEDKCKLCKDDNDIYTITPICIYLCKTCLEKEREKYCFDVKE
jgi:hypothetical protein